MLSHILRSSYIVFFAPSEISSRCAHRDRLAAHSGDHIHGKPDNVIQPLDAPACWPCHSLLSSFDYCHSHHCLHHTCKRFNHHLDLIHICTYSILISPPRDTMPHFTWTFMSVQYTGSRLRAVRRATSRFSLARSGCRARARRATDALESSRITR